MKKIVSFLLTFSMVLCMASCGENSEETTKKKKKTKKTTTEITETEAPTEDPSDSSEDPSSDTSSKALADCFSDDLIHQLDDVFSRRSEGEPLAYIVGHAPFYDLEFSVGEGVLIPRFDTEILVETALTALRVDDLAIPSTDAPIPRVYTEAPFTIFDLCTGTGIIGITVAHELQKRHIPYKLVMTDISEKAVEFAKKNAEEILGTNGAWSVELADLWPSADTPPADLIVSNPPYITKDDCAFYEHSNIVGEGSQTNSGKSRVFT